VKCSPAYTSVRPIAATYAASTTSSQRRVPQSTTAMSIGNAAWSDGNAATGLEYLLPVERSVVNARAARSMPTSCHICCTTRSIGPVRPSRAVIHGGCAG